MKHQFSQGRDCSICETPLEMSPASTEEEELKMDIFVRKQKDGNKGRAGKVIYRHFH